MNIELITAIIQSIVSFAIILAFNLLISGV